MRRRAIARKRAKEQLKPRSPEPVEGRKHIDVQTELYLEELSDRVEEAEVETQTDAFLDRPPSPLFIPAKTGVDVATQILEGEVCLLKESQTPTIHCMHLLFKKLLFKSDFIATCISKVFFGFHPMSSFHILRDQGLVAQSLDSAICRINPYPKN